MDAQRWNPHHTHFVLVPGAHWGDESRWLRQVGKVPAGSHAAITVLANGGEVTLEDAYQSVRVGHPLIVVAGSGRTADAIAAAVLMDVPIEDDQLSRLAASGLVSLVDLDDGPQALVAAIERIISGNSLD
jgi:hypothetical protein